jgi:uncharacterized membrane protein YcjF (UPF0283 family)
MTKYGRPIAEELEKKAEQPKSSGVPFRRRWWVGIELLLCFMILIRFEKWARDAINAMEGANAFLRYGCVLVAIIFVFVCIPLLAYETACLVVIRRWNQGRILQSLQSERQASDEIETKPAEPEISRERASTGDSESTPDASSA